MFMRRKMSYHVNIGWVSQKKKKNVNIGWSVKKSNASIYHKTCHKPW